MLDRAARDAAVRARAEPRYQATSESARAEAELLRPSVAWLSLRVDPLPDGLAVTVGTYPTILIIDIRQPVTVIFFLCFTNSDITDADNFGMLLKIFASK